MVDANGRLIGIISRADVLALFDRSDLDIRKEISAVMGYGFLVDPKELKVTIKDGVVTLSGAAETAELGHDLVQRILHVRGVVAVRDRLVYPQADVRMIRSFSVHCAVLCAEQLTRLTNVPRNRSERLWAPGGMRRGMAAEFDSGCGDWRRARRGESTRRIASGQARA